MPRLKKSVPKYSLHRASGQAIVRIDGQQHYLGPHGSDRSRAEYDRLISEYLGAARVGHAINRGFQCSVAELLDAFLAHAEAFYAKGGRPTSELHCYRRLVLQLIRPYGEQCVDSFGPLALKGLRERWIREGYSRTTINKDQRRIVRIWKWGVGEELVAPEAWQSLSALDGLRKGRTLAAEPRKVLPVELDRIQTTIPHLSPVVADMVRLQMLCGARPGEVCRIRPADIDRSGDVWEYRPESHKTEHNGHTRTIYLGPQSIAILSPYMLRAATSACFSPAESIAWHRDQRAAARTTPANAGNARGRRHGKRPKPKAPRNARTEYDASSYAQAIAYGCRKAWPLPDSIKPGTAEAKAWEKSHRWAPNQIRHTKATEIRKAYGLEAAQVILGHASADVTQIYAERDAAKARDIIRQIG